MRSTTSLGEKVSPSASASTTASSGAPRGAPARRRAGCACGPASGEPPRGLIGKQVANRDAAGQRFAEALLSELGEWDLGAQDRAVVLGHPELDEGILLVPAEQPPVALAKLIPQRRREGDPNHTPEPGGQDERDRDVGPPSAVTTEVPGDHPVPH